MTRTDSVISNPHQPYARQFFPRQGTAAVGAWAWFATGGQTDWSSVNGDSAGYWYNTAAANLDEYKWSSIFLGKGTYKFTIISAQFNSCGIAEVLFGTTSLGTMDMYSAGGASNVLFSITFTINVPTTADVRWRSNGKNGASTNYFAVFSRFQLEKIG